MRIAYLMLAHKSPGQLTRLIDKINSRNVSFFIHIDKKCPDEVFVEFNNRLKGLKNIFFTNRYSCAWGKFSLVQATLEGIRAIVESSIPYDYVLLISGQDYPIKPVNYIEKFLEDNNGKCFIRNFNIPRPNWHNCHYQRVPAQYRLPKTMSLHGGSQWWCLPKACIEYIHHYVKNNPKYIEYFKRIYIPDEMFFQTLVLNSPFKDKVINDGLRYIDWASMPPHSSHPATITKDYFPILAKSEELFARKFDPDVDSQILDMIDKNLLSHK